MTYCFRLRIEVGNQVFLNPEATELVLSGQEEPSLVVLKAAVDGETLRQSRRLVLRGSGYTSNDEATAAGDQWRSLLSISFARLSFGADVDRASGGGYFNARLRWLSQRPGRRVLEDKPGLTTFECDPPPLFAPLPLAAISERQRWREQYRTAVDKLSATDGRQPSTVHDW